VRTLEPALIIDAAAGSLLGASASGWRAWGLEPEAAAPPLALDQAMPALRRLRQIAATHGSGDGAQEPSQQPSQEPAQEPAPEPSQETLTFWTARGVASLLCQVEAGDGGLVAVTVKSPACAANDGAGDRAGSARHNGRAPGHGALAPDVGLDAWLAHELRTPLSAIIAYAEILKEEHFGPLPSSRYRGYARDIYEGARHALGVVDSMLRGDPVRAPAALAFCDLDPAGVVESCLAVVRPLAERAGLEVGVTFTPRLPRVVADELTLKQMLLNLLANAIKFARPGDRVTITVAYDGTGPLRLSVADTGPGMERGAACGSKAEPAATGLGLGLPLSRALAAANGARLEIASEPGKGTCVTISFAEDRVVPV
jgi:hypothetical protein